jgi:hypothetical protein
MSHESFSVDPVLIVLHWPSTDIFQKQSTICFTHLNYGVQMCVAQSIVAWATLDPRKHSRTDML